MKLLIYLVPGLLLGVALNRCGFGSLCRVRRMLAFRDLRPLLPAQPVLRRPVRPVRERYARSCSEQTPDPRR